MTELDLQRFVTESNVIEGITREPTPAEIAAHEVFLRLGRVCMRDLADFVSVCAGAPMRLKSGMDVRVGDHRPPPGGPGIGYSLDSILYRANADADPWHTHVEYETLHPFMDGNGRSGRVLWLWQMIRQGREEWVTRFGFLRSFYYQTLSGVRDGQGDGDGQEG